MAVKNAVAATWVIKPSSDGKRWSAYPAGDRPSVPTWASGVSVNAWVEITGTTLTGFAAGMAAGTSTGGAVSRKDAWCAPVLVGSKLYSAWAGGHTDYYGNEVFTLDLSANSPAFAQVEASSNVSVTTGIGTGDNVSYYSDNRPVSRHTYGHLQYIPQRDWIMSPLQDAVVRNGGVTASCDVFNVATNTTQAALTVPNLPATPAAHPALAQVADSTGDVFVWFNFELYRWNQASNTWTDLGGSVNYGFGGVSAFDSTRGRILAHCYQSPSGMVTIDASTSTSTTRTSATMNSVITGNYAGMCYDPDTDKFYVRTADDTAGDMHVIDPASFVLSDLTTSGGGSVPASVNGVHRLWRVKFGSQVFIVHWPNGSGNLWALRVA